MILGGSVTVDDDARRFNVHIRPKPTLIRSGLLILLIVPLPIFTALVFLGLSNGSWPIGVIGEALSMLLCWLGLVLFRSTFVGVTATSIIEHGFFGRTRSTPLSGVASVVLAHTYNGSSAETLPQLIVRNQDGVRMLRLRGIFWTEESMRAVADSVGGSLELPPEPMTPTEFFQRYAGSAYWFENRPVLAGVAIAALLTACGGLVLGLMLLLGQPILGG